MKHNKENDCWVVMGEFVLDVTDWLGQHPGGFDPIFLMATQDIRKTFEATHSHKSDWAQESWKKRIIGKVDPTSVRPKPVARAAVSDKAPVRYSSLNGVTITFFGIIAILVLLVLQLLFF